MPIGNQLMRARIGTYNFSRKVLRPKIFSPEENKFYTVHCFSGIMASLVLMLYYFLSICLVIFIFHGPKKLSVIKFCHRNLNGLAVHDFLKVSLIEACITTHNFDIICLLETFLDSTVSQHDENIMINGYSLLRADHPSNSKRGGVCQLVIVN